MTQRKPKGIWGPKGSVDENVMLVRLHIRIRNTSVISRDFFLMDLTFSVCFIFVWKAAREVAGSNLYPSSKALHFPHFFRLFHIAVVNVTREREMWIALFITFFTLHANDVIKMNKSENVFIFHWLINLFDVYVLHVVFLCSHSHSQFLFDDTYESRSRDKTYKTSLARKETKVHMNAEVGAWDWKGKGSAACSMYQVACSVEISVLEVWMMDHRINIGAIDRDGERLLRSPSRFCAIKMIHRVINIYHFSFN